MRLSPFVLSALLALAAPAAATAQTPIAAKADKNWAHRPTGVTLPAQLAGLQRQRLIWFSAPEVDVAGEWFSADGSDNVTVYLFRNVSGSVPVWFDRARYAVVNRRDRFGEVAPTGIRAFNPRGQRLATGLMESYRTSGSFRSTALAVLPINGFYAKVRASSSSRDLPSLEALMMQVLNSFNWSSRAQEPTAVAVEDCPSPLAAGKPARPLAASQEDRMMAGLLGGLVAQVGNNGRRKPSAPQKFCREPGQATAFGTYRPDGSSDHFTMAVGDGGRSVLVGRNELAGLISTDKNRPLRYSVSLVHLDKTETYGDFDALPTPAQAAEIIGSSRPVSVAGTWGKQDKQVQIIGE